MSYTVMVVEDEERARNYLAEILALKGYEIIPAATLGEAKAFIRRGLADIILLDVQLPDGYGPSLLDDPSLLQQRIPVILITGFGDIDMAVAAMKNGALDFFQKPFKPEELEKSLERATEIVSMRRELALMRNSQYSHLDFVIGKNPKMTQLIQLAQRAAATSVSVLITGETGTGKEVLARAIYAMGRGQKSSDSKTFIPINCAAIQPLLLESELFGFEAGAFTSADRRKIGLLEVADKGILFLDEISSAPLDVQAKLLRVLEERSFFRVGGINQIKVDVQILAASNRDLKALMADGSFRQDLYYRLKVVDLELPPLRKRKEDIPELVGLFIRKNNQQMGQNIQGMTARAMEALMKYNWPGNIRELRNVIDRSMLFCDEPEIDISHLPADILD